MHKSFDKKSKNLKPTSKKSAHKNSNKKVKGDEGEDNDVLMPDLLEKPKKKVPKKFFLDDDEEILYRIKH